jgi:general secretion pathway protein G
MAVVAKNVVGRIDRAKVQTTKASLKALHDAVIQFKLDTGDYPSQEGGLDELIMPPSDVMGYDPGGYLETTEVPKDAWGRDFIYELSPVSGKPFVIYSYGADGQEGGEGYDQDLLSTDAN